MRILIIDNELSSAEQLEKMILTVAPEKRIIGKCCSISQTIQWLNENEYPDLILSDIQLPDGLCFDLFSLMDKKPPVIFISANNNYAIEAFKARGLHYILKPVNKADLKEAIERYNSNYRNGKMAMTNQTETRVKNHQERFIIHTGTHIRLVHDTEIAYIYTANKAVFLITFNNQKHLADISLETFEKGLNPKKFFRINRQVIININAISVMAPASKQRINVSLNPRANIETITSFERTQKFKKWLTGE